MKISIIVPVYNVSSYINECIVSIAAQEGNIECIIVNDCTQDNSIFIVQEFLEKYSGSINFRIVEHSINSGLSAARNTGINVATGDYLLFLDSDDKLPKGAIERMSSYLHCNEPPCCVIGNYDVFGNDNALFPKNDVNLNRLFKNDEVLNTYLHCQWYPMAWNKLISRNFILENALFFKEGMLHEDELWSYQLALKLPSLQFCHETTYFYRIRNNSITSKKNIKNFTDNLLYCDYIQRNILSGFEQQTHVFLQNRLNVILLDMWLSRYSIDEIWEMAMSIKKQFGIHCYWSFEYRNLVNLIRCVLLYSDKMIMNIYLKKMKGR